MRCPGRDAPRAFVRLAAACGCLLAASPRSAPAMATAVPRLAVVQSDLRLSACVVEEKRAVRVAPDACLESAHDSRRARRGPHIRNRRRAFSWLAAPRRRT